MGQIINVLNQISIALFGGTLGEETITGAIPTFWNWLTEPEVLPFFIMGCGVSLILLAVRVVKGIFWGI